MTDDGSSGRSATQVRDAHRLHEALVIKQAPGHVDGCTPVGGVCQCKSVIEWLWHRSITQHAPATNIEWTPCEAHADAPLLRSVPGFKCPQCQPHATLRCLRCGNAWPCEDVRLAANVSGLDKPGAVDTYLASLPPADTTSEVAS